MPRRGTCRFSRAPTSKGGRGKQATQVSGRACRYDNRRPFESKRREARPTRKGYGARMIDGEIEDGVEAAWRAVLARDRRADGRFVTGVLSTGIYCRPSCAARHPKRENVRFFASTAAARKAGLRACLRCRPDDAASDDVAVARVIDLLSRQDQSLTLAQMAAVAGYSPHHFHRLFRKATGVTPAAFARGIRGRRMEAALAASGGVTGAIYAAGYAAPASFYADVDRRLGMTPGTWRRGGAGEMVRWVMCRTALGTLLVAVTDRGICRIAMGESDDSLRLRFPSAIVEPGSPALARLVGQAVARVPVARGPLQVSDANRVAAFEEAVFAELARMLPAAHAGFERAPE